MLRLVVLWMLPGVLCAGILAWYTRENLIEPVAEVAAELIAGALLGWLLVIAIVFIALLIWIGGTMEEPGPGPSFYGLEADAEWRREYYKALMELGS